MAQQRSTALDALLNTNGRNIHTSSPGQPAATSSAGIDISESPISAGQFTIIKLVVTHTATKQDLVINENSITLSLTANQLLLQLPRTVLDTLLQSTPASKDAAWVPNLSTDFLMKENPGGKPGMFCLFCYNAKHDTNQGCWTKV